MAMTINTNIQSLNAQRNLGTSQSSLATSMQRLSSGLRINSAKDDAAGMAIASRMQTQITGLNQAQRNANDGVSLAQTAEGALSTIGGNLQRIRELAVQSRNATNSTEDRAALQKEVTQLKSEIDRVATTTSFNGTNLLDGSFTSKAFQVGANQGQLINIDSIVDASASQLGEWKSVDVPATAEGSVIKAGNVTATTTAASGTFGTAAPAAGAAKLIVGGVTLVDRTAAAGSLVTADEIDTAVANSKDALAKAGVTSVGTAAAGNLKFIKSDGADLTLTNTNMGIDALGTATVTNGVTAFPAPTAGSLTINGTAINITGDSTSVVDFGAKVVSAIETAFADGSVKASFASGKLTVTSGSQSLVIAGSDPSKFGLTAGTQAFVAGKNENGIDGVDISSIAGADNAILAMDAALKSVNSARADLGAIQNRFESVVSNLSVNSENLSASKSRIMDADFASETANLSRSQILQQAGTAMVAQANQLPQGVLSLLR
jgi:flagellin